jgi:hypothetical protein
MTSELTADDIRDVPKLEPNATRGDVRVTFVSRQACRARSAGRSAGAAVDPRQHHAYCPADRG